MQFKKVLLLYLLLLLFMNLFLFPSSISEHNETAISGTLNPFSHRNIFDVGITVK